MSLMKIAHRLREHDWVSAAIELVIVIVGILIALQVSNWNQGRLDRARAQDDYRRIHADLETDVQRIAVTHAFYTTVSDYGSAALANGEEGRLVDGSNWKTLLAWYQASQILPFELEDTSFAEMRDAGDLGLIADEGLRGRLAVYYRSTGSGVTAALMQHNPQYRVQVRGITPSKIQEYIWAKCFVQLGGVNQKLVDCPSPISEAEAAAVLATYHGTPQLLDNLRYWHTWLGVSDKFMNNALNDQAKALLAEIEKAQKR
jgi:hypothetical protein